MLKLSSQRFTQFLGNMIGPRQTLLTSFPHNSTLPKEETKRREGRGSLRCQSPKKIQGWGPLLAPIASCKATNTQAAHRL
jgi:hypothetical protein